MSLKILQPNCQPLGQFDGLDAQVLSVKGGEVVTFTSVTAAGTDKAAKDSFDGYLNPSSTQKRPVLTNTLVAGSRPLFLCDDGITGYGTVFGVVVGGTAGQVSSGGTTLGPHTATGSGKLTVWGGPGLYGVSLDACDTNASTGLQPTNTSIDAGSPVYFTTAGLLTPTVGSSAGGAGPVVGRFVEFETTGSLVTTPNKLVSALNPQQFNYAVFYWNPPTT